MKTLHLGQYLEFKYYSHWRAKIIYRHTPKKISVFGFPQISPARPSDKSSVTIKMNKENF